LSTFTSWRPRRPGTASRIGGLALVFVVAASTNARAQQGTPSEWSTPKVYAPTPPPMTTVDPADAPPPPPLDEPGPAPPPAATPAPAPLPAPPAESSPSPGYRVRFTMSTGLGVSTFVVSDAWAGWGGVLEGFGEFRFNPWVGLRIRGAWGLTEWDRAALMFNHGVGAGAWTAQAFGSVGNWLVNPAEYFLLKLFPALFAFMFLTFGFVYAGLAILFSPLAATSYIQLGVSAVGHLPLGADVDLFAEGGFGTMTYWHPRTQYVRMGFGPVLGLGVAVRQVSFAFHVLWTPPAMQSSATGAPDVLAASFSVRKTW